MEVLFLLPEIVQVCMNFQVMTCRNLLSQEDTFFYFLCHIKYFFRYRRQVSYFAFLSFHKIVLLNFPISYHFCFAKVQEAPAKDVIFLFHKDLQEVLTYYFSFQIHFLNMTPKHLMYFLQV